MNDTSAQNENTPATGCGTLKTDGFSPDDMSLRGFTAPPHTPDRLIQNSMYLSFHTWGWWLKKYSMLALPILWARMITLLLLFFT